MESCRSGYRKREVALCGCGSQSCVFGAMIFSHHMSMPAHCNIAAAAQHNRKRRRGFSNRTRHCEVEVMTDPRPRSGSCNLNLINSNIGAFSRSFSILICLLIPKFNSYIVFYSSKDLYIEEFHAPTTQLHTPNFRRSQGDRARDCASPSNAPMDDSRISESRRNQCNDAFPRRTWRPGCGDRNRL
jgi:hypothetical protein